MNEISFNWKNIFTNLILLIILVIILAFGFKNNFSFNTNSNVLIDKVYNQNIQTMKDAAKDYFTVEKLPSNIGETKKLSLQEMLNKKLLLNFTDKNNKTCNTEFSNVEVTKITETEYQLKVTLACGEQIDYIVDTIGCYDTCKDCKVETKTEYQYTKTTNGTKTSYSCPEGYSLNGKYCYKQLGSSINATAVYSDANTKITEAKKKDDESYKLYTDSIAKTGATTYKCEKGTLNSDNTCTIKTATTINATPNYAYKCSNGDLQSNNTCKVSSTTAANANYAYKCSNGDLQSNNTCKVSSTTAATANYAYRCNEGSLEGTKCKISSTSTVNAEISSYTYGSWYAVTSYKRTSALATYNNGTEKLVDNGTTREYSCGTPTYCPTKVTYYHYTLYRRSATANYSCSNGTLSGNSCIISSTSYNNAEKYISNYSCSNGTLSGSNCIVTTNTAATKYIKNYSCSNGTLSGSNCVVTTYPAATKYIKNYSCSNGTLSGTKCNVTANSKVTATKVIGDTTYSCPSGYNEEGNGTNLKCYVTRTNNGDYYCDNANQTLKGNKCYEEIKSELTGYTCKDGYTLEGNKCVKTCTKKIDATASTKSVSNTSTKWSTEKTLNGYTSTGKYRIVDEKGKVIKTGTVEEATKKEDTVVEQTSNDDTKLMTVNTNTNTTPSTMEYIMYAIIVIGVIIMAFASITMVRIKRYNN